MAEPVIRRTRLLDVASLPAIERSAGAAFHSISGLEWVADDDVLSAEQHRRFVGLGTSWVAERDGCLAGFACAERFGPDLHVWQIAVLDGMQGRGLGTRLMQVVTDHALDAGATRLTLTTFRDVPFNEGFYRGLGFDVVAAVDLDERLRRTLADEALAGMPSERRCAMRMGLKRAT